MFGCHGARVRAITRALFALFVSFSLWFAEAARAVDVTGTTVKLGWTAASGPVAGYDVQVSRNGGAYAVETRVTGTTVQLSGTVGQTLLVRVAAYDVNGTRGPLSPISDSVRFVSAPTPPPPAPAPSSSTDLDGNGRTDALAVNNSSGSLSGVLLAADGSRRWVTIGTPRDAGMRPIGLSDVDGDGRADVLWRNKSTGANELWLMRGLTYSVVSLPAKATSFRGVSVRDFSGDARADVLWHDPSTGRSEVWVLAGNGFQLALPIAAAPTGTFLAAVADVNGDRLPDLVWQNKSTRALNAWVMRSAKQQSALSLGIAAASSSVVGTGDVDANGTEDLVWVRTTSTLPRVDVWFLSPSSAPRTGTAFTLASGTRVRGLADLDSDGKNDVVHGSLSSLYGRAILPVRVTGSTTLWQTRSISIGSIASASWQFLTLD
jgi:hypothetical protein